MFFVLSALALYDDWSLSCGVLSTVFVSNKLVASALRNGLDCGENATNLIIRIH